MSIVTEVRTRAEDVLEQGKQALETAQKTAQTRFTDAVATVSTVAEKTASRDVNVAGRTVSIETLVADLEELVKRYRGSATDLVSDLKNDDRVTGLVERVEALYGSLLETVQGYVVKPTKDLIFKTPVVPAKARPAAKAPATEPAVKLTTAAHASTAPSAVKKPAKTTVRKAPAKKATTSKPTTSA